LSIEIRPRKRLHPAAGRCPPRMDADLPSLDVGRLAGANPAMREKTGGCPLAIHRSSMFPVFPNPVTRHPSPVTRHPSALLTYALDRRKISPCQPREAESIFRGLPREAKPFTRFGSCRKAIRFPQIAILGTARLRPVYYLGLDAAPEARIDL
jgi:hypothetical protein